MFGHVLVRIVQLLEFSTLHLFHPGGFLPIAWVCKVACSLLDFFKLKLCFLLDVSQNVARADQSIDDI